MSGRLHYSRDVSFVSLQSAVFCVQCELICENSTRFCLACGSQALLSLSRVLGGSLRDQQTAHLIADAELDRLVRELLHTVPSPQPVSQSMFADRRILREGPDPSSPIASLSGRHHLRTTKGHTPGDIAIGVELDLEPGISIIAERAQALTGATGAAIALRKGDEIVCRARTGRTAPDLGVRLQTNSGLSAESVRTGEVLLCDDAETDPFVDLASCRRLGVRSILVAPLRHFRRTLGIFEVLSSVPHAFDHTDITTMQFLASMMVAAISRLSSIRLTRQ
jgi:putative methionine-R-sulfoxide reductase with GAF domain